MFDKLPKLNSPKIQKNFNLPVDYVISKFYELGYKVSHNKYNNVYNCCCPICKEGKSWGRKKRCFYIPENDNIYCHNCGSSLKPYNWIRQVSGMTDQELWHDVENNDFFVEQSLDDTVPKKRLPTLPEDSINLFDPLQVKFYADDHLVRSALAYVKRRRLDTATNKPDALYFSKKDITHKNRLIIPFKDSSGKIIFYQSRKLFEWDERPDYLSKFDSDKSIFGIEKVDPSFDDVFLFEGPIDSCFVKNALGVGGINEGHHRFTPTQDRQMDELKLFNRIWVPDSQWIDKAAREKTAVLLEMGEKVFVWPEKWGKRYKDFNEICMIHGRDRISPSFIKRNSEFGKSAVLKFKVVFGKG